MRQRIARSFSARLMLGLPFLILLTTISAGIPAYLLVRTQLERQAWSQVQGAQQATRSLLLAEQDRLSSLAGLFAERPTLQRLARGESQGDLSSYLEGFRRQSRLDLLLFCGADGQLQVGDVQLANCSETQADGFALIDANPMIMAVEPVADETSAQLLGTAVAGISLDQEFLQRLAADTGVQQSILALDSTRLVSNLEELDAAPPGAGTDVDYEAQRHVIELAERRHFATYIKFPETGTEITFLVEVALPVEQLEAAENRALLILGGSTALVAALGMLLGLSFVRQLVSPLRRLTSAAEQVSEGDLMAQIPRILGPNEISTLATALHHSQASMLQALQERSDARDWLHALVQSIVEGVVTVDRSGRITFISQGAESLSGWVRDEALGQHADTVFPLEGDGRGFLDEVPDQGKRRQIVVRNRAGKSVVLAVTSAMLIPPGAERPQLALVLRDVTQEEALRRLRSYFLANISHEFRTPLSTLNASMELLLDPTEELSAAEMRQLLRPSYLSLQALQALIDNLLESSRIEAGHFKLDKRPADLNLVLESALQMVSPLLQRRQQPVNVGEPGALPSVMGDAARLTQVLVNLMGNASKYSPVGSPIDVTVTRVDGALRIAVADRGPGIAPADRDNVFRRFVRGDSVDGEQYGVGLGLYVVKNVVEAHGGRVGIEDRAGGGAIFWFELPLSEEVAA